MKQVCFGWGFYAHKHINKHAIYSLPESTLLKFFKSNSEFIISNAVKPDLRRYVIKEEACRHFIDLDVYRRDSTLMTLPKYYSQAEGLFSKDTLEKHGILPWHIFKTYSNLVTAMKEKDAERILRIASDLGHYVGDANVPLHTTHNYDGQLSNQKGIHALWESRIPELLSKNYDLLVGKAIYVNDVQSSAWTMIYESNSAVDSVLKSEALLTSQFSEDLKYSFEERNGITIRTYSPDFSSRYSGLLNGQVERQMQKAIKLLADIWYTAWIDAGQPDLSKFNDKILIEDKDSKEILIQDNRFLESHNCIHSNHKTHQSILATKK